MSPRLVPAARGGATGKALAVGAAHHSGGAELLFTGVFGVALFLKLKESRSRE
jgi:hypothetical protein